MFKLEDISEKVFDALVYLQHPDKQVVFESWYRQDIDLTHIVFQQIEEKPKSFSDDEIESVEHVVSVDVFGKDSREVHKMKVDAIKHMRNAGFVWTGTGYEYLREIDYYHQELKFYYLEEL